MVCEKCPFEAACVVGESLNKEYSADERKEKVAGFLKLSREALASVEEAVGCDGETLSMNGQRVCPLESQAIFARNAVVYPYQNAVLDTAVVMKKGQAESNGAHGQYL